MNYLQVAGTSALSGLVLFALARLMGRRQIAQLDTFDYITGITIGSIAAEIAFEPDNLLEKLLAMAVYTALAILLNFLTDKSRKAGKLINGQPLTVYDSGRFIEGNMSLCRLDLGELLAMCRAQGYFDMSQIQTAVLETNGRLSILPAVASRPVTPRDMGLAPAQEPVLTEFIMDGEVLARNLKGAGFDEKWLQKQLKGQGYDSPAEIFLAQWDGRGNMLLYPKEKRRPGS